MRRLLEYQPASATPPCPRRFPFFFVSLGFLIGLLTYMIAWWLGLAILLYLLAAPAIAFVSACLELFRVSLGDIKMIGVASTVAWLFWGFVGAVIGFIWSLLPATRHEETNR